MVLISNCNPLSIVLSTFNNRSMIEREGYGYCTRCVVVFRVKWVREWVDRFIPRKGNKRKDYGGGQTALCPCCGIDSVTPYTPIGYLDGCLL